MSTRLPVSASLVLAAAALLVAGCQTPVNTTEPAQPAGQRSLIPEKRVIRDSDLARHVDIRGVNERVGPAGLLTIQVELLNHTSGRHRFAYKVEWFDAQGIELAGPAAVFIQRQIEGNEDIFITATAPNELAKDFRLKLISTD